MSSSKIIVTTTSKKDRGELRGLSKDFSLALLHHPTESNAENLDVRERHAATEVKSLAAEVAKEAGSVVVLGSFQAGLPVDLIDLARFLLSHSTAEVVLMFSIQKTTSPVCSEVYGFILAREELLLRPVFYRDFLHQEHFWTQIVLLACKAQNELDSLLESV